MRRVYWKTGPCFFVLRFVFKFSRSFRFDLEWILCALSFDNRVPIAKTGKRRILQVWKIDLCTRYHHIYTVYVQKEYYVRTTTCWFYGLKVSKIFITMADTEGPLKEGFLWFPPHGVLGQLKVSSAFYVVLACLCSKSALTVYTCCRNLGKKSIVSYSSVVNTESTG